MNSDKVLQTLSNAGLTADEAEALIIEIDRLSNKFPVTPKEGRTAIARLLRLMVEE